MIYDVPFEMLVQRFVEANHGVDVKVPTAEVARVETIHPKC